MQIGRGHALLLALAVAAVSVSSILARWAQNEGVPSLIISFYRLLFATVMLAPFALAEVSRRPVALSRGQLLGMAGVGFLLAAHFATWVTSLEYTSVASSTVLVTTEALWVPLGTAYLLREAVGARVWVGIIVAFSGSLLLVAGDFGETRFGGRALLGDFLAFAGALAASMYFLAGRRLRQRYSLAVYAVIVYGFSAAFLGLMALAKGEAFAPYTPRAFGIMFLFAFFPMILGHTIINYILRWVPAHFVSTAILVEPVVSALLAFYYLEEAVRPLVLLGGLVILAGIVLAIGTWGAAAKPALETQ